MTSATGRAAKRISRGSRAPTKGDLAGLRIVLTPDAQSIVKDDQAVLTALREAVPGDDGIELPEEVVIWRGKGDDRVAAIINKYVRRIFVERFGADPALDTARRNVDLGIGSRPDLPPGSEYVRSLRHIWRGLLAREPS
jgi:hypothetical protein